MLLFALLAFLFPVAVYCLFLAVVNRRPFPVVISGSWDCLGLLFAGSGFLLVGGPAILTALYHKNLLGMAVQDPPRSFQDLWSAWWLLWISYYVLVITGAILLIWSRRNKTVIYNIDAAALQSHFAQIARDLGIRCVPGPRGWTLFLAPTASTEIIDLNAAGGLAGSPEAGRISSDSKYPAAELEMSSFAPLCHVTLHWRHGSPELQRDFAEALRRHAALVSCPDNPAGTWLLAIAGLLFGVVFLLAALIFLVMLLPPRRLL